MSKKYNNKNNRPTSFDGEKNSFCDEKEAGKIIRCETKDSQPLFFDCTEDEKKELISDEGNLADQKKENEEKEKVKYNVVAYDGDWAIIKINDYFYTRMLDPEHKLTFTES